MLGIPFHSNLRKYMYKTYIPSFLFVAILFPSLFILALFWLLFSISLKIHENKKLPIVNYNDIDYCEAPRYWPTIFFFITNIPKSYIDGMKSVKGLYSITSLNREWFLVHNLLSYSFSDFLFFRLIISIDRIRDNDG